MEDSKENRQVDIGAERVCLLHSNILWQICVIKLTQYDPFGLFS